MKKNLLSGLMAIMVLFSMTACAQITGSKNYITKKVNIGAFQGIKLMGSPDVIYTQREGAPSVEIYGSDNIVPLIETYVEEGYLIIKYKKNTQIRNSGKLEVRVTAPAINQLSVSGSGDVKLTNGITTPKDLSISIAGSGDIEGGKIKCNNLSVKISGSGDINLTGIDAGRAEVRIAGSGNIDVAGNCTDLEYSVSGSGDINGANLKARNVAAHISGSGDIKCHATESLKGGVSGSGAVGYKGSPRIEFSKKGLYKL